MYAKVCTFMEQPPDINCPKIHIGYITLSPFSLFFSSLSFSLTNIRIFLFKKSK